MKEKGSILIVDDDVSISRSLALIFTRKGYEAETAVTAQEGLEKAQERSFHIALIDIKLPDMPGIDLLKKLKDINLKINCMIITGHASVENAVKSLELGASAYITKPLDMDDVLNRIKEALDKQQLEQELVESEERYRSVFENTGTATAIIEEDMTLSTVNAQCEKLIGYSKEEIENKMKWTDFVLKEDLEKMKRYHMTRRQNGEAPPTEYEFRLKDKKGNIKDIFLKIGMISNTKKSVASLTDITERKQAEERIIHLNLVLRTIRNINQLIVKEKNRERLLKGACNSLIKTRGYHNTWIALLDKEGKLKTYAEAGLGKAFLPMIELLKKGRLTACGKRALKQQEVVLTRDPASTCTECPLSQEYSGRAGFTIRLEHSGEVYGLMSISFPTHLADDQEEQGLFMELAGDIALGLYSIKMDKEHKQAEEKYHKLIENTSEGFWLLNSKKLTIEVNQSLCDMLGYTRNEMIGKTPMEFVDAENKKIFKEHISKITNTTHRTYEISLKKKDGINFPTIFNATTLVDKKEETEGSFAFVTDITERKKAEEKFKTTTERLELAMDAGEHGFWDWNLDTDDVYFSTCYYTMLGYKPGELPMRKETWTGLMHPEDRKIIVPMVEKYVANAKPYEVEFRLKTKDGDWKWISGRGKSYNIDKNGISHRAVGVHVNITERKQAEERLKKTLDTTIETVSKIVEVKDPYTAGHQQRVSQLATAIAKELNLSPDKIEGIKVTSLLHDIGKISVPTEILSKTTTLSDIEFSLIKVHSQIGSDILKAIDFSYPVAQIVLQHHERLDGSGYPNKLKGDEILLEARILGVADVVEAMSSHRPYRPSLGIDAALDEISKNKGTLYDPEVVDICLKLFKEKEFKL